MRRTVAVMGRVFDQQDGLGLYCINLLRHMMTLDPGTRYVILLNSPRQARLFSDLANVEAHVLSAGSKLWWDQVTVLLAARRCGANLIFNPKFSLPLLAGRPCVMVLQDADWYVNPGNYPWWDRIYIRTMLPLYCRKARRLLAISQSTRDDLERFGVLHGKAASLAYAAVGPNFDAARDEAAVSAFRRSHRLPPSFMLTVTRVQHSGHTGLPPYPGGNNERLMRAYQAYRRGGGTLPLVVAGKDIEPYLRERGFGALDLVGVQFAGFMPNEQMHLAYQAAEFFVLAKLCESFGLPILEALASGCPAIVPNTCASPEVAAGAARLIDPFAEADMTAAMLELERSPELRARLRARGLERARQFTWAESARRALAVLDEICPRTPAP